MQHGIKEEQPKSFTDATSYSSLGRGPKTEAFEAEKGDTPVSLHAIKLEIAKRAFVCVVGGIESGKSSLLRALIGQMRATRGTVAFGGSVGIVTQNPWNQNASIKSNITFGRGLDEEKLQAVVKACSLFDRPQSASDGIDTETCERGVNLSGGQRNRIALARAAYFDADIVLLDDPLSAVDSQAAWSVSSYIVSQCIMGLMTKKTRILVTHQLDLARYADHIVGMENGRIAQQGSHMPGTFPTLIREYVDIRSDKSTDKVCDFRDYLDIASDLPTSQASFSTGQQTVMKIHADEERNLGAVSGRVYIAFIRALPNLRAFCLPSGVTRRPGCSSLFLGFWTNSSIPGLGEAAHMSLYASSAVISALSTFYGSYTISLSGLGASFLILQRAVR